jgi:hypothetical protein
VGARHHYPVANPGAESKTHSFARDDNRTTRLPRDDGEFATDRQTHVRQLALDAATRAERHDSDTFADLRQTEGIGANASGSRSHRFMPSLQRVATSGSWGPGATLSSYIS